MSWLKAGLIALEAWQDRRNEPFYRPVLEDLQARTGCGEMAWVQTHPGTYKAADLYRGWEGSWTLDQSARYPDHIWLYFGATRPLKLLVWKWPRDLEPALRRFYETVAGRTAGGG